jgi:hypothetical protein
MLEIQSAIDEYERKFPRRPAPSAEVALAWRLGKREAAKRVARQSDADFGSGGEEKLEPEFAQQECNRLAWAWEQVRLQWQIWAAREDNDVPSGSSELLPWVKRALLVGGWSVFAVAVASVFVFGAIVGGFK